MFTTTFNCISSYFRAAQVFHKTENPEHLYDF